MADIVFRATGTRIAADVLRRFLDTEMDVQRIRLGTTEAGARDMARCMRAASQAMGHPVIVVKAHVGDAIYLIRDDIEDWEDWRRSRC